MYRMFDYEMSYKGYHYCPMREDEDDVRKIYHEVVVEGNGVTLSIPFTPYDTPSYRYFQLWVDAGCPQRKYLSEQELVDLIAERHLLQEQLCIRSIHS